MMIKIGLGSLIVAAALLAAAGAAVANETACLTHDQRRTALASHRAIPLAKAMRAVKGHIVGGEVVGVRLCNRTQGLVYVLTVLAGDGKVTHASVDAASGAITEGN